MLVHWCCCVLLPTVQDNTHRYVAFAAPCVCINSACATGAFEVVRKGDAPPGKIFAALSSKKPSVTVIQASGNFASVMGAENPAFRKRL